MCLLVYATSCFEYSFGAMEAHTTIFEFRTSNVAPNGSFVTVGNALFGVLCACLCMLQVVLSIVLVQCVGCCVGCCVVCCMLYVV